MSLALKVYIYSFCQIYRRTYFLFYMKSLILRYYISAVDFNFRLPTIPYQMVHISDMCVIRSVSKGWKALLQRGCVISRAIQIVRQGKAIRIWWAGEWFDKTSGGRQAQGRTHIARRLADHSVTRFFTVRHWFQLVNWFGTMAREKKRENDGVRRGDTSDEAITYRRW